MLSSLWPQFVTHFHSCLRIASGRGRRLILKNLTIFILVCFLCVVCVAGPMDLLGEELLRLIFTKLSLADLIRVRAVCCQWRKLDGALFTSPTGRPSYCPLVFKRERNTHLWEGFDATSGRWAPLPPLPRPPPAINLLPVAGKFRPDQYKMCDEANNIK